MCGVLIFVSRFIHGKLSKRRSVSIEKAIPSEKKKYKYGQMENTEEKKNYSRRRVKLFSQLFT